MRLPQRQGLNYALNTLTARRRRKKGRMSIDVSHSSASLNVRGKVRPNQTQIVLASVSRTLSPNTAKKRGLWRAEVESNPGPSAKRLSRAPTLINPPPGQTGPCACVMHVMLSRLLAQGNFHVQQHWDLALILVDCVIKSYAARSVASLLSKLLVLARRSLDSVVDNVDRNCTILTYSLGLTSTATSYGWLGTRGRGGVCVRVCVCVCVCVGGGI